MPNSRLSAFLSLFLVFFSGAVLGAFAYRLYVNTPVAMAPPPPPKKGTPEEFIKQRLAEMKDRVKADDQQLEQIRQVYNNTREQFDQLRVKMNDEGRHQRQIIDENQVAKIKAILRPDQIPTYDQIRAEHEAAARKRHQQQREQGERK